MNSSFLNYGREIRSNKYYSEPIVTLPDRCKLFKLEDNITVIFLNTTNLDNL